MYVIYCTFSITWELISKVARANAQAGSISCLKYFCIEVLIWSEITKILEHHYFLFIIFTTTISKTSTLSQK